MLKRLQASLQFYGKTTMWKTCKVSFLKKSETSQFCIDQFCKLQLPKAKNKRLCRKNGSRCDSALCLDMFVLCCLTHLLTWKVRYILQAFQTIRQCHIGLQVNGLGGGCAPSPTPSSLGETYFWGRFYGKVGQFSHEMKISFQEKQLSLPLPLQNVLYDYVWPWFKTNLCSHLTVTFKLQLVICYSKQLPALQYYTTINITLVFLIS